MTVALESSHSWLGKLGISGCLPSERRGRFPAQRAMRSELVVVSPPELDDGLGIGEGREPVQVEAVFPELAVEAFHEGILRGVAGLNEVQRDARPFAPEKHRLAVVGGAGSTDHRVTEAPGRNGAAQGEHRDSGARGLRAEMGMGASVPRTRHQCVRDSDGVGEEQAGSPDCDERHRQAGGVQPSWNSRDARIHVPWQSGDAHAQLRLEASAEPFKRKGQETLPSENPEPSAIGAAPWSSALEQRRCG